MEKTALKRYSIQEYKAVAKVGDIIRWHDETMDGNMVLDGQVARVESDRFLVEISKGGSHWGTIWLWQGWVEILQAVEVEAKKSVKKAKDKRKMFITLENDVEGVVIHIKVPDEIEHYYKSISHDEKQQSINWVDAQTGKGVSFYKLRLELNEAERKIERDVFSDFGNGILRNDAINTAILRVVGISKGIKIKGKGFNVNNVELEYYVKRLGLFVKKLWETSISKRTIKSVITFEL